MTSPIVHHRDYVTPLPRGHRFPMEKFARLMMVLRQQGLAHERSVHEPVEAPAEWISLAHDPGYVAKVFACALAPQEERRLGLPLTDRLLRRSRLAAAGTVLTARLALEYGIACNTAGGSHHAAYGYGAGFCVFNDVAIAIRVLQTEGQIGRALVVDLDVHQGDGTADIFGNDDSVFTFSMHAAKNFPARKLKSDLDVGLKDDTGDAEYLEILERHLDAAIDRAKPEIVFFIAGVDPHEEDRLGRLSLTDDGLQRREHHVLARCQRGGLPVAGVIGGGYSADIDALASRHAILHRTAATLSQGSLGDRS